jgi:hypothetical protein
MVHIRKACKILITKPQGKRGLGYLDTDNRNDFEEIMYDEVDWID